MATYLDVGRLLLACGLVLAACTNPDDGGTPVEVAAVSYNIAQNVAAAALPLAATLVELDADFVALQECVECDRFADEVASTYALAGESEAGVAIMFDASRWELVEYGVLELGVNDDGWGQRVAIRAVFEEERSEQQLAVYSTHWCVSVRSEDDNCDAERQLDYANAILREIERCPLPALLLGDLNVFDGFEDGQAVGRLVERGLVDVYRELNPVGEAPDTFSGNAFAPAGRIDYIFSTSPVAVRSAAVLTDADGSDHFPVTMQAEIGPL